MGGWHYDSLQRHQIWHREEVIFFGVGAPNLGGGFMFVFSPLFGEDSHFDYYFSDGLKPPTSNPLTSPVEPVFQKKTQEAEHWNHRLGKVARAVFNLDFTSLLVQCIWVERMKSEALHQWNLTNRYLTQICHTFESKHLLFSRSLIPIHLEIIMDNSMTTFHTDKSSFIQLMVQKFC